jgi:hypothetical protein
MMNRVSLALLSAVFAVWSGMASATNLVNNGDFATETPAGCTGGNPTPCVVPPPGWTGSTDGTVAIDTLNAYGSDTYDAAFSTCSDIVLCIPPFYLPGPGVLSQDITTTPGQNYLLSFELQDEFGANADTFTVLFGGVIIDVITGDQEPPFAYTLYSLPVSATGSSTTLEFDGINDNAAWNLDDVSLTAEAAAGVPEPSTLLIFGGGLMILGWGWRLSRSSPS